MNRARLRDLGIVIGVLPPGPLNAITDVPGVRVGQTTLISDGERTARTGVTVIVPRDGNIWREPVTAGVHSFNGNGEMTGAFWIREAGMLETPIALTNTGSIGAAHEALLTYGGAHGAGPISLPVVAETYDGWLNDIEAFHVRRKHVFAALAEAKGGPVDEGNVGGGTGMICHEFKGGIGTASRVVQAAGGPYTVGALVQANYGRRPQLRVAGVPVGRILGAQEVPLPWPPRPDPGSIIVVLATDAPLLADQCARLARRATVGLARVGGTGHNGSGDLFLAFATGNRFPPKAAPPYTIRVLPAAALDPFFDAVAEAVEEAILNALTAAEDLTGHQGHQAHALPLDRLQAVMAGQVTPAQPT
jgi:D-aminopeptidase